MAPKRSAARAWERVSGLFESAPPARTTAPTLSIATGLGAGFTRRLRSGTTDEGRRFRGTSSSTEGDTRGWSETTGSEMAETETLRAASAWRRVGEDTGAVSIFGTYIKCPAVRLDRKGIARARERASQRTSDEAELKNFREPACPAGLLKSENDPRRTTRAGFKGRAQGTMVQFRFAKSRGRPRVTACPAATAGAWRIVACILLCTDR